MTPISSRYVEIAGEIGASPPLKIKFSFNNFLCEFIKKFPKYRFVLFLLVLHVYQVSCL